MGGFPQLRPHVPGRVKRICEQGVFREVLPRRRRLQSHGQARALDVLCKERIEEAEHDETEQEAAEYVREAEGGDESLCQSHLSRFIVVGLGTGPISLQRPAARLPHAPPRA